MTNKRVLFIHIDFYEYNQRIVNKMCEFGYDVDCFCEDANFNFFEKLIYKFNPQYAINKNSKKQDEFINTLAIQKKQYEFIFVIKGAKLTNKFMTELKQLNPNARFILYLWDDIVRVESFFENKKFYDKIFTFDRIDAEQNGLSFLPLFFCSEFKTNNNKKKIDIYFSGWEHSDRRKLIEKILPVFKYNEMKVYIHIFTGRWNYLINKIKQLNFSKDPEYIKFNTLSLKENAELTKNSKILLDIQHPTQKGLTMRTIEALAAKAKLITTNSDVVKYDFYNTNNILIVDRENPMIDLKFLTAPYEDIQEAIVERYSLTNWIKKILDIDN